MSQFFFALVDSSETTFTDAHKRWDWEIFDLKLEHLESEFATLDITIVNPRIGLLNPDVKQWCWLSYQHPNGTVYPLFFGRIVGLPNDLDANTVAISYLARPEDFDAQKAALAETMKVRPYWDPIWFSPDTVDNPDNVLESRPELWHIDRVTGVVTSSNVIEGEDGLIALGEDDVFYDSVRVAYAAPPVRCVQMSASVSWEQKASGSLDISRKIPPIETLTGEGLMTNWPKQGDSVGNGWTVAGSSVQGLSFWSLKAQYPALRTGFITYGTTQRLGPEPFEYMDYIYASVLNPAGGLIFVNSTIKGTLNLAYDATRSRSEVLNFALNADVQSVLTDPAGQDVLDISMQSSEVTQPVDPGGAMPLDDLRRASYFSTDRGAQSIEYLIALARARLLARARCVNIDMQIRFDDAILLELSCRKNVALTDHRLPGGLATGKITGYSFSIDGDTGVAVCDITIGSTAGNGNTVSGSSGNPDYCEADYDDDDYQQYTNSFVLPSFGDIYYAPINGVAPNDDGVNFFHINENKIVKGVDIINDRSIQQTNIPLHGDPENAFRMGEWYQYIVVNGYDQLQGTWPPTYDPAKAVAGMNLIPTKVQLTLLNLQGGPFETDYTLEVSDCMVPKLIDLGASSNA